MPRLSYVGLSLIALLTACDGPEETPAAPNTTLDQVAVEEENLAAQSPRRARVLADLEFGQFASEVTDLAAWEAVPFGFQSVIYAANGAEGIAAIRADAADANTLQVEGAAPVHLAVAYPADGGSYLVSLDEDGGFSIRALDGSSAMPVNDLAVSGPRDLCSNGEVVLAISEDGGVNIFGPGDVLADMVPPGTAACSAANGDFYLRGGDGWARLTKSGLEPTPLAPDASTLIGAGGEVFAVEVDGEAGGLLVNGQLVEAFRPGGEPLRPFMVKPAYGNLGGVTRDGGLIVLDEERRLYLLPWAEVATALGLPTTLASLRPEVETKEGLAGPALPDVREEAIILNRKERQPQADLETPLPPRDGERR